MKSDTKSKIIILITLGILFAFSPIFSKSLKLNSRISEKSMEYCDDINLDNEYLKISKISEKIHIDNNWTVAKSVGLCTGYGTYSEPYVIEDLVIDGGGSGTCILIENSDVYFKIENCTVYNSGLSYPNAGVRLSHVSNSQLINNNCSTNNIKAISLEYSNNNTISGNIINDNFSGLSLEHSDNNTILGNTVDTNRLTGILINNCNNNTISGNILNHNENGIYLVSSVNHTLSGNIMNGCGLELMGLLEELDSYEIDIMNLVNGRALYYYTNEVHLRPTNFSNARQVILVNCNDSLVSNLNTSYSTTGISLFDCNNNTIFRNTANNNNWDGIKLENSNYNNVTGNIANKNDRYGLNILLSDYNIFSNNSLIGNSECINEFHCEGNIFDNNNCGATRISGYNLFFLIGILSVATIILKKKLKKF